MTEKCNEVPSGAFFNNEAPEFRSQSAWVWSLVLAPAIYVTLRSQYTEPLNLRLLLCKNDKNNNTSQFSKVKSLEARGRPG